MAVRVGPWEFDVLVEGPADAPAVLLLHGFPQSNHCWRLVRPWLRDFHVLAPNQRGYSPGARPASVEDYRVPLLAQDAIDLLDVLEVDRAHVVGHDWGAANAWQIGSRFPARVRTLTTISTPHPGAFRAALVGDPEQRTKSLYMRDFAKPGYAAVLLADDALLFRTMFGELPATVDVDHMLAMAREPGALDAWLHWYAAQRKEDVADTPIVTVPTMHVWSDGDVALGRAGAEASARFVSGPYRFEVLEGVSHWIQEEAADQLGGLLVDFFASSPPV